MALGSGIRISDPGVKKAPDPGSTLVLRHIFVFTGKSAWGTYAYVAILLDVWIQIRDIQRLPTTPFSLVYISTVHRATLTQYIPFKRGGIGEPVLFYSVL
jgi:hypothetical protein